MQRALPIVFALALGLVGSVRADHDRTGIRKEGTPVAIVGQVTSQPHKVAGVVQKHFQIALGPRKQDIYTLHIKDAEMVALSGDKFAASDLDDKQWVRAEGTIMNDPHRIKVSRLTVVAKDTESVRKTKFFRTGFDRGYIEDVTPPKPQ